MTWFVRFAPVFGSNKRPARMATPSGGGGCIVSRAASNGPASGRPWTWARTRAGFPESQAATTNARAVFSKDLQVIAKSSGMILSSSTDKGSAYLLHPNRRVSNQKSPRKPLNTEATKGTEKNKSQRGRSFLPPVTYSLFQASSLRNLASCLKSSILSIVDRANIVIIGGGVVGCAVARAVSQCWGDVLLVEQMPKFGMGASTRNSGVIHSGIYYPPGSLKAQLCVAGNRMLQEFCARHNVPHRICGKLVVAHGGPQEAALEQLAENGRANGVEGLRLIDRDTIHAREPHIEAAAALEVPSTGIVSA